MSVTVNVNGVAISYPQTGDSEWGDEATDFAIQTGSALGKIGLSTGTSVDITSTLDVTGATTLDSTLTVAGTTNLNGTANLNGNTNLGNATSDTIAVTGILNVDSGTLYVDPTNNRVGINDSSPSEALDVVGNALVSGTLGVTGNSTLSGNLSVDGNTTLGNASGDNFTINGNAVSIPNGLNIDSNTFVVDATNNRVGIGTSTPSERLDIRNTSSVYQRIESSNAGSGAGTIYKNNGSQFYVGAGPSSGLNNFDIVNATSGTNIAFQISGSNNQINAVVPGGSTLYRGYLCRAWVSFNGTAGTVYGHGNVQSISKNGAGDYTINFITAMPDTNYSVQITTGLAFDTAYLYGNYYTTPISASSVRLSTWGNAPSRIDNDNISVAVFR